MQVPVLFGGERLVFNIELDVDAHTAAFVGVSVRDAEDSAAVVDVLDGGVATTGAPPIALLLDSRPSNHTPDVDEEIGGTIAFARRPSGRKTKLTPRAHSDSFPKRSRLSSSTGPGPRTIRRAASLASSSTSGRRRPITRPRSGRSGASAVVEQRTKLAPDVPHRTGRQRLSEDPHTAKASGKPYNSFFVHSKL